MIEDTETYYRRRWKEELLAAEQATDANVANIHRSLAARYSILSGKPQARSLDEAQPTSIGSLQRLSKVG